MKSTLQILQETRTLLSDKTKWAKGTLAFNGRGQAVAPNDPSATKWCLMGGISLICGAEWHAQTMDLVYAALRAQIDPSEFTSLSGLGSWNDKSETTHELILQTLDKAITHEKGLGSTQ